MAVHGSLAGLKPRWVLFTCLAAAGLRLPAPRSRARARLPDRHDWTVSVGDEPHRGPPGQRRRTGLRGHPGRPGAAASTGSPARPCGRSRDGPAPSPSAAACWRCARPTAPSGPWTPTTGPRAGRRSPASRGRCPRRHRGAHRGRGRGPRRPRRRHAAAWCGRRRTRAAATAPALTATAVVLGEADGQRPRAATSPPAGCCGPTPPRSAAAGGARRRRPTAASSSAPPTAASSPSTASKGNARWTWRLGADVQHPAALFERLVLFATHEDVLYALDRGNGHLAWRAALPSRPLSGPVLFGDAVLVACHGARPGRDLPHRLRRPHRRAPGRLQGRRARRGRRRCWSRTGSTSGMRDRAHSVVSLHLGAAEGPAP